MLAGQYAVMMGTSLRGNSNAKMRNELGFEPRWPNWREGLADVLADAPKRTAAAV